MKKLFFSAMALIVGMSLISCDPEQLIDAVSGDATITISCAGVDNLYEDGQTIDFSSCVTDMVIADSEDIADMVFLAANINLLDAQVISAPYMGFMIADTSVGTYQIDNVITAENIVTFTPANLLTTATGVNVFVLVANDTALYIAKEGSITLNSYPDAVGRIAEGTFNNVRCYYVVDSQVNYLKNLINAANNGDVDAATTLANLNMEDLFPVVAINGSFNSRRMIVQALLDSMEDATSEE